MRKILLGVFAGFSLACLVGPLTSNAADSDTYHQLNLFGDVFERVRADYVEKVDDSKLIEAAINGMLTSLDPHSSYMNPKNYREMQIQTRGEFGGLGIEVTMENGVVKVVTPIDGTPASRAGIKPGDLIVQIDQKPVMGMSLSDAVEQMRGPIGSKITLTIQRKGTDQPFDVTLTRDTIQIQSVRWHKEKNNIGYIRVTSFNEQTDTKLEQALKELDNPSGSMVGLILDLRNDPGGLLDQAIAVSDAFLDHGEIVSTRGRHPEDTQRFNAHKGDLLHGKPMIVLINGGSASASEIVAGALQDHRRAILLGTKSFGKGSVQTIIPLGADGALRLTTALYYTPSGRSIQAKGIEPDILVEQARVEPLTGKLHLPSEADLRGHLVVDDKTTGEKAPVVPQKNTAPQNDAAPQSQAAPKAPGTKAPDGGTDQDSGDQSAEPEIGSAQDYQLAYAVDLLHGIALMDKRAAQ
jgi:carboxyl-terminal processing protease